MTKYKMGSQIHANHCDCDDPSCRATRTVLAALGIEQGKRIVDPISDLNAVSRVMAILLAASPSRSEMDKAAAVFITKMSREAVAMQEGRLTDAKH